MAQNLHREQILTRLRSILPDERHEELTAFSDSRLEEVLTRLEELGVQNDDERRSEPRRAVMSRVEVIALPESGEQIGQTGLQEDTSARGASVVVPKPVAAGTRVRIARGHNTSLEGIVRHCGRRNSGWALGIEYDSPK